MVFEELQSSEEAGMLPPGFFPAQSLRTGMSGLRRAQRGRAASGQRVLGLPDAVTWDGAGAGHVVEVLSE